MENFLWVFYFIVLLAATSCALQAEGAPSDEAQELDEMVTSMAEEDHITIANQGGESGASGSTIYVTLPPDDQAQEVGSVAPSSAAMPLSTEAAAAPQPSSSPLASSTTMKAPMPPLAPANEIPPQADDAKPVAKSKNSHEKASAMESGAFPTASSLPILVGVVALTLLVQS